MMKQSDHGAACPANPMYGCAVLHLDKKGNPIPCDRECNCGVDKNKMMTVGDLKKYLSDIDDNLFIVIEHEFGCYTEIAKPSTKKDYARDDDPKSFDIRLLRDGSCANGPFTEDNSKRRALVLLVGDHYHLSEDIIDSKEATHVQTYRK